MTPKSRNRAVILQTRSPKTEILLIILNAGDIT